MRAGLEAMKMEKQTNYCQCGLSRRSMLRRAGLAASGLGALALAGCMGKSDKGGSSMVGASSGKTKAAKAELVLLQGGWPHVSVYDADSGALKRYADIPGLHWWSMNDSENYFDGKNLWALAHNRSHFPPEVDGSEVVLLDLDSLTVTARIPVGNTLSGQPSRSLSTGRPSADGRMFVGEMSSGVINVIDIKSRTLVLQKRIEPGLRNPDYGTAGDGQARLYAATNTSGRVLLLDPKTLEVQQEFSPRAGTLPWMLTVAPGAERVWVLNGFNSSFRGKRNSISVLDGRTLAVVNEMDSGATGYNLAFSPDGKLAYISHSDAPHVSVFDTARFEEVRRVDIAEAEAAWPVAIHPDGRFAWVQARTSTLLTNQPGMWFNRIETETWKTESAPKMIRMMDAVGFGGLFMRTLA